MNREFLINLIFLLTANVLIKPLYVFGVDMTVQNRVGDTEYGIYAALLSFSLLFQVVLDVGTQYYHGRELSKHRILLGRFFPNLLVARSILAGGFVILLAIGALASGFPQRYYALLPFIGFNVILISSTAFLRSTISGLGRYRLDSFLSILDKALMIVIIGTMLLLPSLRFDFQIEWFVYGQTAAYALTCLIAASCLLPRLRSITWSWNKQTIIFLLKKSYPIAIMVFLMTAYTRVDMVMIERLFAEGSAEAGRYAAAFRLLDFLQMGPILVGGLLLPMLSRQLVEGNAKALASLGYKLMLGGTIPLVAALWISRIEIMDALYINASNYWGTLFGILVLSLLGIIVIHSFGTLLLADDQLKLLFKIYGSTLAINLILNAIMIPRYGAYGAALTTLATQSTAGVIQLLVMIHKYKLRPSAKSILQVASTALATIVCLLLFQTLNPTVWWLQSACVFLLGIAAAMLSGLIDLRGARSLLKRRT